jgi:RNA polymerase sigma factor (sigma-70 family)
MAKGQLNGILQHLRRIAVCRDSAARTDGELLEGYLTAQDELAFEALLLRHGPMVLGVCRRVLRNEADAHDAFQATFLVFVRKAASIVPRARVGNWLHGVAYKTALKARAMSRQRRAKELQAMGSPQAPPAEAVRHDLLARLDEALRGLPERYRAAIVLCHLEERSLQEAARQLGCPQGTVASRLARARSLLARRLARWTLSVSGPALTTALAHGAAPAPLPAALIAATVQAATVRVAGPAAAGVISAPIAALTEAVLGAMRMARWKALIAGLLAVALLGGGALLSSVAPGGGREVRPEGRARSPAPKDQARTDQEALQGTWVAVSGERSGRPLSEAQLQTWGQLVFAGDRITRNGTEPWQGRYTIEPDHEPRAIDVHTEANAWKGIYELTGARLKLCLPFDDQRPTEFHSRAAVLLVFEKR